MTGRTEPHICQGNVAGLYYVTESIVMPYDNARAHPVHMCSKITCSFSESRLPMASKVLRPVSD